MNSPPPPPPHLPLEGAFIVSLGLTEVSKVPQGHAAAKWQNPDLSPKPGFMTLLRYNLPVVIVVTFRQCDDEFVYESSKLSDYKKQTLYGKFPLPVYLKIKVCFSQLDGMGSQPGEMYGWPRS